jgi:hypothetical protein
VLATLNMKNGRAAFQLSFALVLTFLGGFSVCAEEFIVRLLPVADTGLYQITPTNNLGASTAVPAGAHSGGRRSRYLMRFDPGHVIPAGAQVTGAELQIQVAVAGSPAWDYSVHRMLQSWGEGAQGGNNGAPAAPGETTWLARYHPSELWAAPGGMAGADYFAVPSASGELGGDGSTNWFSGPGLVADVQAWLTQPESNFGWMIRATDETVPQTVRRLASRETTNSPVLVVRFRPPDTDQDGVSDLADACPDTPPGVVVNASGCSLAQIVPCEGWANHGQYVAAFAAAADQFVRAGLLTPRQRAEAMVVAAQADCGR